MWKRTMMLILFCLGLSGSVFPIGVDGTVCTVDGRPLAADVTLLRMRYPFPNAEVVTASTQRSAFSLPVKGAGLYLLRVEAAGCERVEIPVLLDARGKRNLRISPPASGAGAGAPLCSDGRLVRWAAIHRAQCERHARYEATQRSAANGRPEWGADLRALIQAIDVETDAPTRSFLAACYMDLGLLGADLDAKKMAAMARLLPGDSPFWSINFPAAMDVVNNAAPAEEARFLTRMEGRHTDPEVRAFAILVRITRVASEYDVPPWRTLFKRLQADYPTTLAARSARKNYDPAKARTNGEPFPSFTLTDLDGKPINPDAFKGKVVLVDFWATWCPPCVQEMPGMHEVYERYHREGFEILSLAIDDNAAAITGFRRRWPMPWIHAIPDGGRRHPLPASLMVDAIPRAFLIGRDGRIVECRRDLLRGKKLADTVARAMRAPAAEKQPAAGR